MNILARDAFKYVEYAKSQMVVLASFYRILGLE